MRIYKIFIPSVTLFLLFICYYGAFKYHSWKIQTAYASNDHMLIDSYFNWDSVLPKIGQEVASSFSDTNSRAIGEIVSTSFRRFSLDAVEHAPHTNEGIKVVSEGFTNFDEYTINTAKGSRLTLTRHGLKWTIDRYSPSISTARAIGIQALAYIHRDSKFEIHGGDIYFGPSQYGCRLTATSDVQNVVFTPVPNPLIAFVREFLTNTVADLDEGAPQQLWVMNLQTMETVLMVDGTTESDPMKGTVRQLDMAFTNDGQFLYFLTPRWATSTDIMELDFSTKQVREVTAGNNLYVVQHGVYAGTIITSQHRYYEKGGSYDWEYVVDRTGKELFHSNKELDDRSDMVRFIISIESANSKDTPPSSYYSTAEADSLFKPQNIGVILAMGSQATRP